MFKFALASLAASVAVGADVAQMQKDIAEAKRAVEGLTEFTSSNRGGTTGDQELSNALKGVEETLEKLLPSIRRVDGWQGEMENMQKGFKATQAKAEKAADTLANSQTEAINSAKDALQETIDGSKTTVMDEVTEKLNELMAANSELVKKWEKPVADLAKVGNSIGDGLAKSHYMNPKAPVYRWNTWHGYHSGSGGWFQGNSREPFGGIHPSEWVDGNQWSHNMNSDFKYLKRLFNKEGYGDASFGTTVCADTWHMPHSTDDRRCGAVFRIKNTGSSNTNLNLDWSYSGWCGWGNRASTSVNRRNVWGGCCSGHCSRGDTYTLQAGKTNTVIFIAGGTHPHGHWNYMRSTFLAINKWDLPNGVEFVDDMDTVSGSWAL